MFNCVSLSVSVLYSIQVCNETGGSSTSCCIVEIAIGSGIYKN